MWRETRKVRMSSEAGEKLEEGRQDLMIQIRWDQSREVREGIEGVVGR
jgi:hypothetical protein